VWCYYFVGVLGLGIVGIGIANVCSSTIQLVALLLFTHAQPDLQEALFIPSLDQVFPVYDYITLAIPGTLMLMLDWGAFEILVLLSGLIGVDDQAACILVMNIVLLAYIFSEGFDTAACTLVGNQIGAGDLQMARQYYKSLQVVMALSVGSISVFVYLSKEYLVSIFTNE